MYYKSDKNNIDEDINFFKKSNDKSNITTAKLENKPSISNNNLYIIDNSDSPVKRSQPIMTSRVSSNNMYNNGQTSRIQGNIQVEKL